MWKLLKTSNRKHLLINEKFPINLHTRPRFYIEDAIISTALALPFLSFPNFFCVIKNISWKTVPLETVPR